MIKDIKFPLEVIDQLFPHEGEEGERVWPTSVAEAHAKAALGIVDTPDSTTVLEWHLPDVFDVRYGSSYVASAWVGSNKVRFHTSDAGDFREGDDNV